MNRVASQEYISVLKQYLVIHCMAHFGCRKMSGASCRVQHLSIL